MGKPRLKLAANGGLVVLNQSYEAAGQGRRAKAWVAPASGPNRSLGYGLQTLRNRSRGAYRNNAWVYRAVESRASNEVGVGVSMRSAALDKAYREATTALWLQSRSQLDPEGLLNFGGIQAQATRTRLIAGEAFIRRRRRRTDSGLVVPLQVQVLDPEFVPLGYHKDLPNGHYIRDGIEYHASGRRVAYHMHKAHPQDDGPQDFGRLERVRASEVIHHYQPTYPGQRRGEPASVRSLLAAHTFDLYEDAELQRKQTRAPFTGAIYREAYQDQDFRYDPFTGAPISGLEDPQVDVESGTFLALAPGEKMQLFDADDNGAGTSEYGRQVLLKISSGFGVPYELMTGDWKNVNDRVVRPILQEYRRSIEAAQDHLLIFQVCLGIWGWWMDSAVFSGRLEAPEYAVRRHEYAAMQAKPHAWPYVHPEQDINAKIKALEFGLTSRQEIRDGMPGATLEEVDEQNADDESLAGVLAANAGKQAKAPTQEVQTA